MLSIRPARAGDIGPGQVDLGGHTPGPVSRPPQVRCLLQPCKGCCRGHRLDGAGEEPVIAVRQAHPRALADSSENGIRQRHAGLAGRGEQGPAEVVAVPHAEPALPRRGSPHTRQSGKYLGVGEVQAALLRALPGPWRIALRALRRQRDRMELGVLAQRQATALDAGVPLKHVQEAASHADPRTTMRYDKARVSLDRHATYIVAAYLAGAAR